MNYLVAGLGNIGPEYADTRHNAGFMVLDAWAQASNAVFQTKRYGDIATVSFKGRNITLLKPSTYMNLSGNAVRYWVNALKIPVENLLVICDDLNIPFGTMRMRKKGSDGGHNGLKSIIHELGSENFPRVKVGVGAKPHPDYDLADWVLSTVSKDEQPAFQAALKNAAEAALTVIDEGVPAAAAKFNGKLP